MQSGSEVGEDDAGILIFNGCEGCIRSKYGIAGAYSTNKVFISNFSLPLIFVYLLAITTQG